MNANTTSNGGAQAVQQLKPQPAAKIFPPKVVAGFAALLGHITKSGQIEAIVLHDCMIFDGCHRYRRGSLKEGALRVLPIGISLPVARAAS